MSLTSGIRAGSSEYAKRILLKDKASYYPWKAKITSILDTEDCYDIVRCEELALALVAARRDEGIVVD